MILLRRIVFYSLVAIYLVFCPMTIFYALGFVYKPGSEHGIMKTGLIYVSTVPAGAEVYLNDQLHSGETPSVIRNLDPGYYNVRVELKGRKLWTQEVPVEAERASVLEKLLLLPDALHTEILSETSFDLLEMTAETSFLLLSKGKLLSEVWIYDLKEKTLASLADPTFEWKDARVIKMHTASKSKTVILQLEKQNAHSVFQFDLTKKDLPKDLSALFPEMPEKILWSAANDNHLVAYQDRFLNCVRTDKKMVFPKVAVNILGFGIESKNLYVLRADRTLVNSNLDGKNEKILLKDSVLGEALFSGNDFFMLDIFSSELILFLGNQGELIVNRLPYRFAQAEILGYDYAPKQKKLLVWTEKEIGEIDFSKPEDNENDVFERGPRLVWMFTKGASIRKAAWVYDASHVVFADRERLFFLDLETFNKPEVHELVRIEKGSGFAYTDQTGLLYFLEPERGRLTSAELLPKKELILLPFPTRTEKIVRRRLAAP